MIRFIFLCVFILGGPTIWSQKDVFLNISPVFNADPLQMDVTLVHNNGDSYALDHFDYYVSDVTVTHDGGQESSSLEAVYLMEPENHTVYLGNFDLESIEQIEFTVGVPPRLNTQDGAEAMDISSYPETHPLSFQIPSMYWGWSFGYMPMIIGGSGAGGFFELHSVGQGLQKKVDLPVIQTEFSSSQINIELNCHVDRWVNGIQLSSVNVMHGASPENVLAMNNVNTENVFTISPSASILSLAQLPLGIYFSSGQLFYSNLPESTQELAVYDPLGRLVLSSRISNPKGAIDLQGQHRGPVFVFCKDLNGEVLEKQTLFIH
jgi:hypothetical protein